MKTTNNQPVWLITGSSRGFGADFVQIALENGCKVAATARKPEAVTEAFGEHENLLPVALDVTNPEQIARAVQEVINTWGKIDVLVNNAGYGFFGALEECTEQDIRDIFETNVFGLLNVTRAVLPFMREQKSGRIVNLGSMASYACDPGGVLYGATKHAVVGISEALSLEMAPFGVETMVVYPGMFRTSFFGDASMKTPENLMEEYAGTPARGSMDYCLTHDQLQYGDPKKAAQFIYSVVTNPEPMPLWLPVGKDSFKKYEKKLLRMVESIQPYKEAGSDLFIDQ